MNETQRQRLERLLPGSKVHEAPTAPPLERWTVTGWRDDGKAWRLAVLGVGSTEREAIDRALFLWGARR